MASSQPTPSFSQSRFRTEGNRNSREAFVEWEVDHRRRSERRDRRREFTQRRNTPEQYVDAPASTNCDNLLGGIERHLHEGLSLKQETRNE